MSLALELVELIYTALLVREGQVITPAIARDRAANIAMALVGNYDIKGLPPLPELSPEEQRRLSEMIK